MEILFIIKEEKICDKRALVKEKPAQDNIIQSFSKVHNKKIGK